MKSSLANKALVPTVLIVAVVIAAMIAAVYHQFRATFHDQALLNLKDYVEERVQREAALYESLRHLHEKATNALQARLSIMTQSNAKIATDFDTYFPLQADGTRRSSDALYDGVTVGDGLYVEGLGAFIADGENISPREKRLLLAAFYVVSSFGEANLGWVDNFYFYTPENRLIIFAPYRDDRLVFYRDAAPAEFDFTGEEVVQHTLPVNNPEREMRCTKLVPILYDQSGKTLTTGCQTPLDIDGEHVGAWGNSIILNVLLKDAIADHIKSGHNFILDRDGELIAHPLFRAGTNEIDPQSEEEIKEAYNASYQNPALYEILVARTSSDDIGVIEPPGPLVYAAGRIKGPKWTFVTALSKGAIREPARKAALDVLYIGVIALFIIAVVVFLLIKIRISNPLQQLTKAVDRLGSGDFSDAEAARELPFGRADEIGALALRFKNMSEQLAGLFRSLDAKVKQRTQDLERAVGAAERANRAKSAFLANMSHEVRTPLTGVMGMLRLLLQSDLKTQQAQHARIAMSSAEGLLAILNDILDYSKLEAGALKLEKVPFGLRSMIEDVLSLMRPKAEEKSLNLTVHTPSKLPEWIEGDPARMRQILLNLLGNAIKFTKRGAVRLRVDAHQGDDKTVALKFEITDTGIGIPDEMQDRLFERFVQAADSTSRTYGGSGLGLAICKQLVDLMGGEIGFKSEEGRGSTFWIKLSARITKTPNRQDRPHEDSQSAQPNRRGLRVLVAEDSAVNRQLIATMLGQWGHYVSLAEDGRQAVEKLQQAHFDVVLMDVAMPVMDGVEATKQIREADDQSIANTPIIALTANAMSGDRETYLEAGMNEYVTKPIDWDEMRRKLDLVVSSEAVKINNLSSASNSTLSADDNLPLVDQRRVDQYRPLLAHSDFADGIKLLMREAEQCCSDITSPETTADPVQLSALAHMLKGMTGNFGCTRLADLAARIEVAAAEGSPVSNLVEALPGVLKDTRQELDKVLGESRVKLDDSAT